MKNPFLLIVVAIIAFPLNSECSGQQGLSANQLQQLLKRFPDADSNDDGKLSRAEALAYRKKYPARVAKGLANWRRNRK